MRFLSWLGKHSKIYFAASLVVKSENSEASKLSRNVRISTDDFKSHEDPESSYLCLPPQIHILVVAFCQ